MGKWIIIVWIVFCIIYFVLVIYTLVDKLLFMIECKRCDRRNSCSFSYFSKVCPKRDFLSEEERKELKKIIDESD